MAAGRFSCSPVSSRPAARLGDRDAEVYALAVLIPGLAVSVRRLHDTNRSGWWILTGLVPILGWIALLIFYVEDSRPGANQYGPNPKGV